jgi:hypothetical protein
MKKAIAEKWVKALRSGKFEQAEGFLKRFDSNDKPSHCCLGVLCELYNNTMRKNKKKTISIEGIYLPIEVQKWAGMKSPDGGGITIEDIDNRIGGIIYTNLASMNDLGKTFGTISKTIEQNFETL